MGIKPLLNMHATPGDPNNPLWMLDGFICRHALTSKGGGWEGGATSKAAT